MFVLQRRKPTIINTDPMSRCYNGVHYSSEKGWTAWEDIRTEDAAEAAEAALEFFQALISGSSIEYRICER